MSWSPDSPNVYENCSPRWLRAASPLVATMAFEQELDEYINEQQRIYQRAMQAPLGGLSNEQIEAIKKFQFDAKTQKETFKETAAGLRDGYKKLVEFMLTLTPDQVNEVDQCQKALDSVSFTLAKLRAGLAHASQELEKLLIPRGIRPDTREQDVANPIDPNLSVEAKIQRLQQLSLENEPLVKKLVAGIDERYATRSNTNHKTPEKIAEKAKRPEILKKQPWHDVEHIRDSFRFKTILPDLSVLPAIAHDLKNSGIEAVKVDTGKLLNPGMWGWRIVVFDLRMPNGQLVEYYLPVQELESAKNDGNHKLFEKWRNKNLSELTEAENIAYAKDQRASDDRYESAWNRYLKRTQQDEDQVAAWLEQVHDIFNQ